MRIYLWILIVGVTYTLPVGVGQPPTEYTLLIDTGRQRTHRDVIRHLFVNICVHRKLQHVRTLEVALFLGADDSNRWIGAQKAYKPTSTSVNTRKQVVSQWFSV